MLGEFNNYLIMLGEVSPDFPCRFHKTIDLTHRGFLEGFVYLWERKDYLYVIE